MQNAQPPKSQGIASRPKTTPRNTAIGNNAITARYGSHFRLSPSIERKKSTGTVGRGAHSILICTRPLAVAGDGAQLARQEVVRRPRTADRYFAVLQLLGGGAVAVLVLFHALGIDQVGDVDQHALGCDLLTADFFLERVEQLVRSEEHTSEL